MPEEEASGEPSRGTILLRMFVAGGSSASALARQQLDELLDGLDPDAVRAEVIDVFEHPELADRDRVLATPVLIRVEPPPRSAVIGDLSDRRTVIAVLDLPVQSPGEEDAR